MRFVDEGLVRLAFQMADSILRLSELAARYADRAPDLADLCLTRGYSTHPPARLVVRYPSCNLSRYANSARFFLRYQNRNAKNAALPSQTMSMNVELNNSHVTRGFRSGPAW